MTRRSTAEAATHLYGDMPYHQRAQEALPILVRQAIAGKELTYGQLALELGMPNPRNLNFPLGSVGTTLLALSEEMGINIPPIQCLVINQKDRLPGEGIAWFLKDRLLANFTSLSKKEKHQIVQVMHKEIFAFKKWHAVLGQLDLVPSTDDFHDLIDSAGNSGGHKESEDHIRLKLFVANYPALFGIESDHHGHDEVRLPSADRLDVSFYTRSKWIAVEVKSKKSDEGDITRGLFQCIKYGAVMTADLGARGIERSVRALLVVEQKLPSKLVKLAHTLGVEFVEVSKTEDGYEII